MPWQRMGIIITLFVAGSIAGILAIFAYRHRRQTGAKELSALMVALAVYTFSYGFQLSGNTLSQVLLWEKGENLGCMFIPLSWIMLVNSYGGLSKRQKSILFHVMLSVSIILLLLDFTNNFHHLYYYNVKIQTGPLIPIVSYTAGPACLAYMIYLYASLFGGIILLIASLARTARPYRSQIHVIICGTLVTWLGNIFFILGLTPYHLDLSPFTFTIGGLIIAWGVFRHKLLDLAPVAREVVFENMRDGVLILDGQNRMIDYNPAAQKLFPELTNCVIGRDMAAIFSNNPQFMLRLQNNFEHGQITIAREKDRYYIEVRLSPILSKSWAPVGKIIILTDITQQREAQTRLIQTEKSAVLGQLVSNVVHEMNTPLAAIKATAENIEQSFDSFWRQWVNLIEDLDDGQKQLWLAMMGKARPKPEYTAQEEQGALDRIASILQEHQIKDAYDIARSFVELGIAGEFIHFLPLLCNDEGKAQLKFILAIAAQRKKMNDILKEEERADEIVHALKSYAHPSG